MIQAYYLKQKQSLPFPCKVAMSKARVRTALDFCRYNAYISFSGGLDSMVLMHLVKSVYPDIPVVYLNTGVEYPSVHKLAVKYADVVLQPKRSFNEVLLKFGMPVVSKEIAQKIYEIRTSNSYKLIHKRVYGDAKGNGKLPKKWRFLINAPFNISHHCCNVLKKAPVKLYEKRTGSMGFIGTLADDSRLRQQAYLNSGCNSFATAGGGRSISKPLSFWLRDDILTYIKLHDLPIASVYNYVDHTGCTSCLFGCHLQDYNKLALLKEHHPGMYAAAKRTNIVFADAWIRAQLRRR